jgi:hypothetical protein
MGRYRPLRPDAAARRPQGVERSTREVGDGEAHVLRLHVDIPLGRRERLMREEALDERRGDPDRREFGSAGMT